MLSQATAQASPQSPSPSANASTAAALRAGQARAVFAAHCVECHGPDLKFPKSDFGYVTDLDRLAASDLIVPGSPDASRLWQLLVAGDMPPEEASTAPPSTDEKETVRAWIEGLASKAAMTPLVAAEPASTNITPAHAETTSHAAPARDTEQAPATLPHRLWTLAGHAHVVAVHFPIALLIAAAGVETLALARSQPVSPATRTLARLGAAGALAAATLGWALAWNRSSEPGSDLWIHRWLGTVAAVAAVLALAALERTARTGLVPAWVRAGLVAIGVGTALAAHFGGVLVHGANWMRL